MHSKHTVGIAEAIVNHRPFEQDARGLEILWTIALMDLAEDVTTRKRSRSRSAWS